MDTLQILRVLKKLQIPSYGVFPVDKIPKALGRPAGIIANTDDHKHYGSHWVALFVNKIGHGVFFYSYGMPPKVHVFQDRLRKNTITYTWNTKQLQSFNSKVCGQFCIMFLYYMNKGYSLNNFRNLFTTNQHKNDLIVTRFYNKIKQKCNKRNKDVSNFSGQGKIRKIVWIQSCIPKMM